MVAAVAAGSATAAAAQPSEPAPSAPAETTIASELEQSAANPEQSPPPSTRQAAIEEEQAAKAANLEPYTPGKAELLFRRVDTILEGGTLRWHPFFDSAYSGGGFTLGVGHASYVSAYNYIDVRGSYSISGYKRAEAEFVAPRLFDRRAHLSVLGGWREATQVGFFGIGTDTSIDDRTNYLFQQPYGSALFTIFPTRRVLMLRGGVEFTQWSQQPGEGSFPSVEERYTPETLPGLGAKVNYLHTQGTVGLDWRTSPGYSRRGAFLGVTLHDYEDQDEAFGFQMVQYEGIAHLPILRESWVLSFRGRVQTAVEKDGQQIPLLHAAGARRRVHAARLQQLAVPRREQSAAAGGVAHHGQSLPRPGVLLRCRQGHRAQVGSRPRWAEGRLWLRLPLPRAVLDAAPCRAGQQPRKPIQFHLLDRPPRSEVTLPCSCHMCRHAHVEPDSWRCRSARSASSPPAPRRQSPRFYPDDPIAREPESQDARRRRPTTSRRCTSWSTTCSSTPATSRAACARRTSTRSTRCRTRAGSPTGSAPGRSRMKSSPAARTSARRPTRRSGC